VGTVSHVQGWLAGSADVAIDELDLAMDTAVLIGVSPETVAAAVILSGNVPDDAVPAAVTRLAQSKLRHVQIIDSRSRSELQIPDGLPDTVVIRDRLVAVGVVGRNRARAVRCTHPPDRYGRVLTEDLRAQLLLRPCAAASPWGELDEHGGQIAHAHNRVRSGGKTTAGLYVAGWAGRAPSASGSHTADAAAVVEAITAGRVRLPAPDRELAEVLGANGVAVPRLVGWSAVAATEVLLDRFAGEGKAPLADYDALIEQVDED
jgi:hypothetical protein